MCARVLLEDAVSHPGHPSFKPFCNYMAAYEGVGVKLAEQLVITAGEKELEQRDAQFHCPGNWCNCFL